MLLNPEATKKLHVVVQDYFNDEGGYSGTTHRQRNAMAHEFLKEAEKLLDQQAESVLKRAVEQYMSGALSYEAYMEIVERVSCEEGERGAEAGRVSARNKAFEVAQKALDAAQKRRSEMALLKEQKEFEATKQGVLTHILEAKETAVTAIATAKESVTVELERTAQAQKEQLTLDQQMIREQTEERFNALLATRIDEARAVAAKEAYEQAVLAPGRDAVDEAMARVKAFEQRTRQDVKNKKTVLFILGLLLFGILALALLFSWPTWTSALPAGLFILFIVISIYWTPPEREASRLLREIDSYKAQAGEYTGKTEAERNALFVERVG